MTYCKCGLSPNYLQSKEEQKEDTDYIEKHGYCSDCEKEANDLINNTASG